MMCAVLMLVSGVTHNVQLYFYGTERTVLAAAIYGSMYLVIGLLLLGKTRLALILGVILPAIGGIGGTYRFLFLHRNPFSAFHVLIDLVVVPGCCYLLYRGARSRG
jgi:hypothetical protein